MNRLQTWSLDDVASTQDSHVEQSIMQTTQRRGLHYSLFSPVHYEKNYAYPLVVWLHGAGDNEKQLTRVMPLISMRNYVAVAPRGTSAAANDGFEWRQDEDDIAEAQQRIYEAIDVAKERFNIAPHRVFLAGLQCGGTMAFRVALAKPREFAGVLSVAGPFPQGNTPLTRLDEARNLPLFIAHGRDASHYPVERACGELRLFHVAGMSVTLRQYPCGDDLHMQMLSDMDVWMMEQVTGIDSRSDEHQQPPALDN